ncbi:hypothetical protein MmiAt1_09050 [Methanimicrococcus sp. At1]|uniref:Transcriptional regulator, AbiEi antitoxin, Type IV TA system n=2 Tax=Methanimicrococcus hacksteinii TaxID=3028293 RepID=A0ABU3VPN0_9EURY|nr:hypothetical protein [Methanimicrococcus sp. At1]
MKREIFSEKIKKRILSSKKGSVFVTSDFLDIANTDTVSKTLSRLVQDGTIRRVLRGVYEYPIYSDFLGEYVAPSPDKIAHALARNYGWTIVPFGDTALNLLGLSTQVPAVWIYVSDGIYKEYKYGRITLKFKKTANKEISKVSYKTALVIQALKSLGKENVNEIVIQKISARLTDSEKQKMNREIKNEAKYVTTWIYEVIEKISEEK